MGTSEEERLQTSSRMRAIGKGRGSGGQPSTRVGIAQGTASAVVTRRGPRKIQDNRVYEEAAVSPPRHGAGRIFFFWGVSWSATLARVLTS
jgi:hypothetical protein